MSRYQAMFEGLSARNEGAFGAFLMLGDPDLKTSARLLDALVEGGADMIEVGIPFSDPIADGQVIQAAARRALEAGTRVADCFELLSAFRARHSSVPVGILTYANLVLAKGMDNFCRNAAAAGVDSLLVADVPALEAEPFVQAAVGAGVNPVLIAAANTPEATLKRIASLARGYTYCVTRTGVTGARAELRLDHRAMLESLARAGAPPAIFGFGISRREHVRAALEQGARGVICGSAIVRLIEAADSDPTLSIRNFVASMKRATLPAGEGASDPIMMTQEDGDVRR
jgi:tryptophan synthase alpha chain